MLKDVKISKKHINSVEKVDKGVYLSFIRDIEVDGWLSLNNMIPPFGNILPSGYIDSPELFLNIIAPIVENAKGNYVCELREIRRHEGAEDPVELCVYYGGYFGSKNIENKVENDEGGFGHAGELWVEGYFDCVYYYEIYEICNLSVKQKIKRLKFYVIDNIIKFLSKMY